MNRPFFDSLMKARRLSVREVARRLDLPPSQVSFMLQGKRRVQLVEAVRLAQMLGVTLEEVAINAGVEEARLTGHRVSVVGILTGDGTLAEPEGIERTTAPAGLPKDCVAIQARTSGTRLEWLDGFVMFAGKAGPPDGMVGHFCHIQLAGGQQVVGRLRNGYEPGTYSISGPYTADSVAVTSVAPIITTRH